MYIEWSTSAGSQDQEGAERAGSQVYLSLWLLSLYGYHDND
jgi:hypothetical protein